MFDNFFENLRKKHIDRLLGDQPGREEPQQETLEDAMNENGYHDQTNDTLWREGVLFGAKWQQEQDKNKYGDSDMIAFALFLEIHLPMKPRKTHHQLLEQFKKK